MEGDQEDKTHDARRGRILGRSCEWHVGACHVACRGWEDAFLSACTLFPIRIPRRAGPDNRVG